MNILNLSVVGMLGLSLVFVTILGGKINEAKRVQLEQSMSLSPIAAQLMRVCESTIDSNRLVATYATGHELNICACAGKNISENIDPNQTPIIEKMIPIFFGMTKSNLQDPAVRQRFNQSLTNIMDANKLTEAEVKGLYKTTIDNLNMCAMPSNIEKMNLPSDPRNKVRTPEEQAERDAIIAKYKKERDQRAQRQKQAQR